MNVATEPTGFFGRLRERLSRSATRLTGDFTSLFRGREIDAELLDDLEARLIGADVGVEATQAILENLRAKVARRELGDAEALMAALRAQLVEILSPCAIPLAIDRARKPYVIMVVGVNGSGKTTSIGKLAIAAGRGWLQGNAGCRRHVSRRRRGTAGYLGRTQRRGHPAPGGGRGSGLGGVRRPALGAEPRHRCAHRRHGRQAAQPVAPDGRTEEGAARDPAHRSPPRRTRCCWCWTPTRDRTRWRRRRNSRPPWA